MSSATRPPRPLLAGGLLGLALLALGAGCPARTPPPEGRPNVVLIVADDLGWADVGWHRDAAGPASFTPRLDRLAAGALRLERFYAQPVCSPTRAALLTGRDPMRIGLQYSVVRPWTEGGLSEDEVLLSEVLGAAGYRTGAVGKWHLGHRAPGLRPLARGFDTFYGHLTSAVDYFTHEYAGIHDWQRDGEPLREEGYATDLLAAEAAAFVRAAASAGDGRPFFLYLPFGAPHAPLQADAARLERFAHVEDPDRRAFVAMVAALDEGVGRVLDALEEASVADDTVVVFLSDNGGDPSLGADNGPLRGGKGTTFEGGVRVPALLRYGAGGAPAGDVEAVLSATDVFPTVLGLCGVEPPEGVELDGRDAWPVLAGRADAPPRELGFAVEHRKWSEAALLAGRWKLVRVFRPPWQDPVDHLFDLAADPGETRDVAADHPDRVAELRARLAAFRARHPRDGLRYSRRAPEDFEPPDDWAR